jgi:hypothetical protein
MKVEIQGEADDSLDSDLPRSEEPLARVAEPKSWHSSAAVPTDREAALSTGSASEARALLEKIRKRNPKRKKESGAVNQPLRIPCSRVNTRPNADSTGIDTVAIARCVAEARRGLQSAGAMCR